MALEILGSMEILEFEVIEAPIDVNEAFIGSFVDDLYESGEIE